MAYSDNNLVADITEVLTRRLPSGWQASPGAPTKRGTALAGEVDAILKIRRPGAPAGVVLLEAKARIEPRDVDVLSATLRPTPAQPVLVVAPFISQRTQERLKAEGFGYADLTGNVCLSISEPGLFIETTGATENPEPELRARKSLKGPKAGRLVRALCDFLPPVGLRELAKRAGVDAGYTSRVIEFLSREALVVRATRGPVTGVDWPALLKRWSQEYSPFERKRAAMYLAPRGLSAVIEKLKNASMRFAVSGSWAAAQVAPVAPPRLLLLYVDRPAAAAGELDLRAAEVGGNVALATPFDTVVYERTLAKGGVTVAALSQVAVDLLTSSGRGPNEAEALMKWMQDHEDAWRA
ncbi:MAG: hypothetical protein HY655_03160 [Acidobacteria bacterium]|nr:hypothetical protein [Acidobacteriota bacterium]